MRERKYVKFKVDMYSDTKFKIIDRRPERDLIHYVWNRVVVLAGKCNQEGDLYMSRTIPYTVETLAIEFNRGPEEVKLALYVLMELEMVELTEDHVYRVKNFAKHQNIIVKEKTKAENKEDVLKGREIQTAEVSKNENPITEVKNASPAKEEKQFEKEIVNKENANNNSRDSIPIFLEAKNNKKGNKKIVNEIREFNFEENNINPVDGFYDEERPLGKGEHIIMEVPMFGEFCEW